jgi:hypothetical protein
MRRAMSLFGGFVLTVMAVPPRHGRALAAANEPDCAFYSADAENADDALDDFNDDADAAEAGCAALSSRTVGVCALTVDPEFPMINRHDDGSVSVGQTLCCECGAPETDAPAPSDDILPSQKTISL